MHCGASEGAFSNASKQERYGGILRSATGNMGCRHPHLRRIGQPSGPGTRPSRHPQPARYGRTGRGAGRAIGRAVPRCTGYLHRQKRRYALGHFRHVPQAPLALAGTLGHEPASHSKSASHLSGANPPSRKDGRFCAPAHQCPWSARNRARLSTDAQQQLVGIGSAHAEIPPDRTLPGGTPGGGCRYLEPGPTYCGHHGRPRADVGQ